MEVGHLDNEGTLQMLAVKDQPNAHLEAHQEKGAIYDVVRVDIDDPDPEFPYTLGQTALTSNDEALVRRQPGGGTRARRTSRGSRAVYERGVVYFTSTCGAATPRPA